MKPIGRQPLPLRLAFLGAAAALPAFAGPPAEELTGVITQARGAVEVLGSGVRGIPAAHLWQTVRAGAKLRVEKDGFAGVVCSNRRFVRIPGPVTWPLSPESCATGTPLSEAQYALVAPGAGRFRVVSDLLVVDRRLRGEARGDAEAPQVVAPRNSAVRSARPDVFWTPVPEADAYVVEWRRDDGGRGVLVARFQAEPSACRKASDGPELCSLAWPKEASDLAPDRPYLVSVSARNRTTRIWHAEPSVAVKTLSLADAKRLAEDLQDPERLGLEGAALEAAQGGLLASRGLFSDAAAAYRAAIAESPRPEFHVTLADLYLETELYDLAEPLYREALTADPPAVRAAAAFGLARIAYERRRFPDAETFFQQARKGYAELGLSDETEAAEKGMKRSAERSKPRPPAGSSIPASPEPSS